MKCRKLFCQILIIIVCVCGLSQLDLRAQDLCGIRSSTSLDHSREQLPFIVQYPVKTKILAPIKNSPADFEIRAYRYNINEYNGRVYVIRCIAGRGSAEVYSFGLADTKFGTPNGWLVTEKSFLDGEKVIYKKFVLSIVKDSTWEEFFNKLIQNDILNLPDQGEIDASLSAKSVKLPGISPHGFSVFEVKFKDKQYQVKYDKNFDGNTFQFPALEKINNINSLINKSFKF